MSFLFTLEEDKLGDQLPSIFDEYERLVEEAEPLFQLEGMRLELIARNLPYHQAHYMKKSDDMKQVVKWLENYKAKLEAKFTKNYMQGQRSLTQRDANTLIAGEREIVELNQLIIEAALIHGKLNDIVEGFKQMGWMVQSIVKLRIAELQETVI